MTLARASTGLQGAPEAICGHFVVSEAADESRLVSFVPAQAGT
jgi:hypothetical protein